MRDFGKEEFDIIIQAGQSNSEGYGIGEASEPFIPNDDIYYFNSDFTISRAQERVAGNNIVGDFSLSFCTEYIKSGRLGGGRKLLVIRAAVGGTGFADKRWGPADDLFLRMMDMTGEALMLNPKNRLAAFLWHQGETDAGLNAGYETHFKNLSTLVDTVRNTFHRNNLPFIAGDFVRQWKTDNIKICEPVVRAIRDVCASIGNARFVLTDELLSNDEKVGNKDTIHFCRDALNRLGRKYFEAFCQIQS